MPFETFDRPKYNGRQTCPHGTRPKRHCELCKRVAMNARYHRLADAGMLVSRKSTRLRKVEP